jgi:precorrin-2/cobalt-factor-2 C20-methyltransferase
MGLVFQPLDPKPGTLTGLGLGPGDPDLITLKALKALQAAPVVAFPRGRPGQMGVAQRIVIPHLQSHQIQLPLDFPFVVADDQLQAAWQRAAEQVWTVLQTGQDVVFACEGDISFYGTFTYLADALALAHPDVTIHRISGVCSPMAAVSALGIPLTVQAEKLAVLPAFYGVEDLEHTLDWADVVVLMKVRSVYAAVWAVLKQRHLLSSSYVVVRASQSDQVIYRDLENYPDLDLPYFSLMVIRVGKAWPLVHPPPILRQSAPI